MEKNREIAIEILEVFENLLNRYDIDIPDEDREGEETEARIYGRNWYFLEDTIKDKLDKEFGSKK